MWSWVLTAKGSLKTSSANLAISVSIDLVRNIPLEESFWNKLFFLRRTLVTACDDTIIGKALS